MTAPLVTEDDLAAILGMDAETVAEKRRREKWEHVRMGRFTVRYTDEQVRQIVEQHTVRPKSSGSAAVTVPGQTPRSAAAAARRRAS